MLYVWVFKKIGEIRVLSRKGMTWFQTVMLIAVIAVTEIGVYFLIPNQPPKAVATVSETITQVDVILTFSASDSSDPDGEITYYRWDFGDGSTAAGETVTHSYTYPGRYIVLLTVTDDKGAEDTNDENLIFIDIMRKRANLPSY